MLSHNGRHLAPLPAYSDRIVQDSHLIPFYPRRFLIARGTENPVNTSNIIPLPAAQVNSPGKLFRARGLAGKQTLQLELTIIRAVLPDDERGIRMSYLPAQDRYQCMRYPRCGQSGLLLPAISLGLWHNFGDNACYETMKQLCFTAFDHGITHFDLANNYGPPAGSAEQNLGRILKEQFHEYRDELLISTKAGYFMWDGPYGDHGSRKYLLASLDQSLRRLGLEYVDIFYHHRMDPDTPLEETMGALAQAVRSGKALYAGLSNYDGETLARAADMLHELHCPFVLNQNRYSIFDRTIERNGLKETSARLGKGIIAFSPLAQGLLTDRYLDGIPEDSRVRTDGRFLKESSITAEKLNQIHRLNALAASRGQTLAQMALSWVLRDGKVTSALIGASRPEQILSNLDALKNLQFSEEELRLIDEIALS